jgi:hypothetical protein
MLALLVLVDAFEKGDGPSRRAIHELYLASTDEADGRAKSAPQRRALFPGVLWPFPPEIAPKIGGEFGEAQAKHTATCGDDRPLQHRFLVGNCPLWWTAASGSFCRACEKAKSQEDGEAFHEAPWWVLERGGPETYVTGAAVASGGDERWAMKIAVIGMGKVGGVLGGDIEDVDGVIALVKGCPQ